MSADAFALPEAVLADYLAQHVEGFRGPLTASKFKGGQSNPTYRIDAASGRYVLRRKPPGALLPSAHAVDREFRVLRALHGSAVPVARALHLCSDESVIGSMFYLMEHVDGRVFWDPALPELDPASRGAHYEAIVATLAALHAVDVDAVGLGGYGKPGNYFARQLARWSEQYRASETQAIAAMETLLLELPARCPADDGRVALVHGDYRVDNLMFAADAPRVLALMDWELSTLGHPLADLGYLCMALRLPGQPPLPGLAGTDRAALGIPDEAALLRRYSELSGTRVDTDWPFVLAFSFFRLAAIAQGVAKRAQQGNASSDQARQAGRMADVLAQLGVQALRDG
ncbi:phosphotransferase family protein [Lysobacter koreensis]|uniref:Phosphotransferase family protein n=1 Tax=Lysobacter koreensis TaxID=266122 RepID=A0ABW2YMN2_9GAMM